jgi:hypothetical protein
MTASIAVSAFTNHARSVDSRPARRSTEFTTPYDASSIHRNVMLTITPGTAHGRSSRLRSHRRAGKTRLNSSATSSPNRNAGISVPIV